MAWLPKQTIVVPIDFSDPSFEAASLAATMVASPEGLHLINVQMPMSVSEAGMGWSDITDEQRVVNTLKALEQAVKDHGLAGHKAVVRVGSPGVEIAQYARDIKADLIVIPSHGRTGLKHLLIGSVAERVARHAPCPVLMLRRKD